MFRVFLTLFFVVVALVAQAEAHGVFRRVGDMFAFPEDGGPHVSKSWVGRLLAQSAAPDPSPAAAASSSDSAGAAVQGGSEKNRLMRRIEARRKQFQINSFVIQEPRRRQVLPPDHADFHSMSLEDIVHEDEVLSCLKADIRRQIKQNWKFSAELNAPIVVQFLLSEHGTVSNLLLVRGCGSTAANQAALAAVNAAVPFKYPPASPRSITFTFDKRINSGLEEALSAVQIADAKVMVPLN